MTSSQHKPYRSRSMKQINHERKTGSMLIPAWIEASDNNNIRPSRLDPLLALLKPELLGDRRAKAKPRKAKIVISALVKAILDGDDDLIYFQRGRGAHNSRKYEVGHKAFLEIMDDLIRNGYLIRVSDPSFLPVDNLAPRYRPSEVLIDLIPDEQLEFDELLSDLKHNPFDDLTHRPIKFTERTLSKSEKAKGLKFKYEKASQQEWDAVSEAVIRLRQTMSQHQYDGLIINGKTVRFKPLSRQFKSHIKNYGRYHSNYQGMPSGTRLNTIRIDGEVCCEIDIVASIPSVLHGIQVIKHGRNDNECFDYYQAVTDLLPELTRKAVKVIFAASLGTGSLNPKSYPPKFRKDFPEIVEALSWRQVRSAMLEGMPQIALLKNRAMDWAYLDYRESEVLRIAMENLLALGIGILPIHDSIIVPLIHKDTAKQIFSQAFFDQTGVWPLMKVE